MWFFSVCFFVHVSVWDWGVGAMFFFTLGEDFGPFVLCGYLSSWDVCRCVCPVLDCFSWRDAFQGEPCL